MPFSPYVSFSLGLFTFRFERHLNPRWTYRSQNQKGQLLSAQYYTAPTPLRIPIFNIQLYDNEAFQNTFPR